MAGGTDNIQLKLAANTRWRWRQQFVDNNEADDGNDDNEHDKHNNNDNEDDEQDKEDNAHNKHDNDKHDDNNHDNDNIDNNDNNDDNDDNKADTATAVGSNDTGGNSDGQGHRQQSTKIGSKDMVAVATAIC